MPGSTQRASPRSISRSLRGHRQGQGRRGQAGETAGDLNYSDNPGFRRLWRRRNLLRAVPRRRPEECRLPRHSATPRPRSPAQAAGVGNSVTLKLGGKVDPGMGGGPLARRRRSSRSPMAASSPMARWAAASGATTASRRPAQGRWCRRSSSSAIMARRPISRESSPRSASSAGTEIDADRQVDTSIFARRLRADPARGEVEVDTGALSTRNFEERPYNARSAARSSPSTTSDRWSDEARQRAT